MSPRSKSFLVIKVPNQAVLVSFINHIIYQWMVLLSVKIFLSIVWGAMAPCGPLDPPLVTVALTEQAIVRLSRLSNCLSKRLWECRIAQAKGSCDCCIVWAKDCATVALSEQGIVRLSQWGRATVTLFDQEIARVAQSLAQITWQSHDPTATVARPLCLSNPTVAQCDCRIA